MKIKLLCFLPLLMLASFASAQTITRCGGPTNALYINWPNFHFDQCHSGYNPYERILNPSNVGNLVQDWFYPISAFTDKSITSSPVVVNGALYVVSPDGPLFALNASTGALLWQKDINAIGNVDVVNNVLYVSSFSDNASYIYALDPGTGAVIWQSATQNSVESSPTVVDGIVYVNTYLNFVALDAHTGALLWQQPADSVAYGSPVVVNGIVYNGSGAGTLYALNARTGTLIWKKTVGSAINGSPAVLDKLVYVSSYNSPGVFTVYALNVLTGAVYFQHPVNDSITVSDASPAPTVGGIVYVSSDSTIWALDALSGALHWKSSNAFGYGQSAPAGADNVLYVGSAGTGSVRSLYAFEAGLGTVLWHYDFQSSHSNLSSPAIVNGVLYIGTGDGYMFAFHLPGSDSATVD